MTTQLLKVAIDGKGKRFADIVSHRCELTEMVVDSFLAAVVVQLQERSKMDTSSSRQSVLSFDSLFSFFLF